MDQQSKNIIRVEKNQDYTVINNTSLYDERLSWKAKAIHVFMLSKPDNWTFYNEEMVKWAKDGADSFSSGLKELKKFGYVKKEQRRGKNGKFEWVTVVYEVPQESAVQSPSEPPTEKPCMENPPMEEPYTEKPSMGNPSMEKPSMEKPFVENPELLNTNALSTESLSTDIPNTNTTNQPTDNSVEQNNTPQENDFGRVVVFYRENIHPNPAPIVYEKLGMMYDLHPIADLALEALQLAVLNHAKNHIHYAESILIRWRNQNITTLEQARFEQQKEGQPHASNQRSNADRRVPSHDAKIADEGIRSKLRNFSSQPNQRG